MRRLPILWESISKSVTYKSSLLSEIFKHNKMIKKLFTILFLAGIVIGGTQLKAQTIEEIKQKKELFKVYTEMLDKNLELAKERQTNLKLTKTVNSLNRKSDRKTDNFSSSDPKTTSDDAKRTGKLLKQTEVANKDLAKSNSKKSIEEDLRKIMMKMDKYNYIVEVKNK